MDMLPVIKIALFVPFILVFVITAIVYLIKGYKKDFGKSLISLAATVVSICVSMLLSKIISTVLSEVVASLFPAEVTDALSQFGSVGTDLIEGVIGIVLSFVLFGLIFLICMAILKGIGRKIHWSKPETLTEEKPVLRLASMGIRVVDALLITVMLLLPVYGTMAMAAPTAASALRISESFSQMWTGASEITPDMLGTITPEIPEESSNEAIPEVADVAAAAEAEESISAYAESEAVPESDEAPSPADTSNEELIGTFEAVAKNPVLALYKFGPGDWVYSGLSRFSINGNTINIAAIADAVEKIFGYLEDYREAVLDGDSAKAMEVVEKFVNFAEKKVINKKWSYSLIMALADGLSAMAEVQADAEGKDSAFSEMYNELKPLLDMTYDEYKQNAEGILNFAKCFIELYGNYSDRELSEEETLEMRKTLCTGLGELLNCSDQLISVKRVLLQRYAQNMFNTLPDANNEAYASYYADRKKLPDSGAAFIKKYFGDGKVPEKYRTAEAMAFLSMMDSSNPLETAEAFVRHPLFGADAVLTSMDEYLYIVGCGSLGMQLAARDDAQQIYKAFDKMLKDCEKAPADQPLTFKDSVYAYLTDELGLTDGSGSDSYENAVTMIIGEDGKAYRIPEELIGIIPSPLDEETIRKYGLQAIENDSEDTFVAIAP